MRPLPGSLFLFSRASMSECLYFIGAGTVGGRPNILAVAQSGCTHRLGVFWGLIDVEHEVVARALLLLVQQGALLVHTRAVVPGVPAEGHVQLGEEFVEPRHQLDRLARRALDPRPAWTVSSASTRRASSGD